MLGLRYILFIVSGYRSSQAGENIFSGGFKTNDVLKLLTDKRKKLRRLIEFLEGMGGKNETGINLSFNRHL
jgi:hypothetical protein